jgi:hypothetical protein
MWADYSPECQVRKAVEINSHEAITMLREWREGFARLMRNKESPQTQPRAILAGEVRSFSPHLPPVLTDRERLAAKFLQHRASRRATAPLIGENIRQRDDPPTR